MRGGGEHRTTTRVQKNWGSAAAARVSLAQREDASRRQCDHSHEHVRHRRAKVSRRQARCRTGDDTPNSLAWTRTAAHRLEDGSPGSFGYSLFAVSRADLRRLRDLYLDYVRAMQQLIAASDPAECVGLYCSQLLDLGKKDNALRPPAARSTRR